MPTFVRRTALDLPVDDVFAWHMRPGALERLTPPWEDVRVLERSGGIRDGGTVVLGLAKGPVRLRWKVKHTAFEEGRLFRDEQVSGPFGKWVHTHRFLPAEGGGSVMEDEVEWEPPLGALGRTFGSNVIEDTLDRLFTFRHERLRNDLERHRAYSFSRPMTVAITGSTGLVGSALSALLTTGGHRVLPVVRSRRSRSADVVHWDIRAGEVDAAALEGVDAVVHLAGESLVAFRWTEDKKKEIRESRKLGTGLLARTLARLAKPPKVLLSSSAVGFYGDRGNEVLTEDSGPGKGFLAEVCKDWEAAAEPAQRAGIRVVRLRSGLVLSAAGGALPKMLPAFKAGVAGRLGRGDQYMSWIDIDDALGMVLMALHEAAVTGPLNGTAPHPVTNATFTTTLGRVLGRPTVLPVPGLALKALFGQMGSELFLSGQRVLPRKADSAGFEFLYPGLEDSLRFQLGRHSRGD